MSGTGDPVVGGTGYDPKPCGHVLGCSDCQRFVSRTDSIVTDAVVLEERNRLREEVEDKRRTISIHVREAHAATKKIRELEATLALRDDRIAELEKKLRGVILNGASADELDEAIEP